MLVTGWKRVLRGERSIRTAYVASRFSGAQLFVTRLLCPWGISRQEYWSGLPCPPPGNLPHPGIKPRSLTLPALAGGFFTSSTTLGSPPFVLHICLWNLPHPREGNGTPLQYSCLDNPMDGGAWWAAVHGVTTERLHFHFLLSCIREGNGSPFQCSCLENPRDSGAWWAAIYGIAQNQTWLKQLSSSSSSPFLYGTKVIIAQVYFLLDEIMFLKVMVASVQFSRSVVSDSLRPHESQHSRPPCPSLSLV